MSDHSKRRWRWNGKSARSATSDAADRKTVQDAELILNCAVPFVLTLRISFAGAYALTMGCLKDLIICVCCCCAVSAIEALLPPKTTPDALKSNTLSQMLMYLNFTILRNGLGCHIRQKVKFLLVLATGGGMRSLH